MSLLQDIPTVLLLLPALSLAAGLDLYLTLLFLGLSPHTGLWSGPLPGALGDLDSVGVHLVAGGFYVFEALAERWPASSLVWNGLHAVIRPLAGALLALLLLEGQPARIVVGGAAAGALLSSLAHGVRNGSRVLLWLRGAPSPNRGLLSAAEDVVALALVAITLDSPWVSAGVALLLTVVALLRSRIGFRAFLFAIRLGVGRAFGSLGQSRWRSPDDFPSWLQTDLGPEVAAAPGVGLKGTAAAAVGLPGAPSFARGWLVIFGQRAFFSFPTRRGTHRVDLDTCTVDSVAERPLFRRVQLGTPSSANAVLCVGRDGPGTEALAAELRR